MSYQHVAHESYPPPAPPGGYNPTAASMAGQVFEPPPPLPPRIGGQNYNYNYPGAAAPQLQSYGSYDYPHHTPSSFLRACLAALCCCCVFEECCINW